MVKMKMCALFVILALASQHASGVEVEVYEGEESVPLPCQFAAPISKDHVIVWRRDDLHSSIIHSIVEGKVDLSSLNKRYSNRTSMSADALQTGDLSLTLRKPTFTDSGTYTCLTRKDGEEKQRTEVQLKVKEHPPVWPIILSVGLVGIVLLISVLLNRVKERQNSMTVCQLTPVKVTEGHRLSCCPTHPDVLFKMLSEWSGPS
uniref:V-set domain containing T-cell activation inhibitor 1 n=1 Tax=Maylandia zebra TaxID=106582 RepID=UPI000D2FEFCA|nr:V-set domain containing T-cell activation inhibitor 1-like [Maylandia zebra]